MTTKELQRLAREERNRYAREWRAKNPEKVAAINQKYWETRVLKQMIALPEQEEVN